VLYTLHWAFENRVFTACINTARVASSSSAAAAAAAAAVPVYPIPSRGDCSRPHAVRNARHTAKVIIWVIERIRSIKLSKTDIYKMCNFLRFSADFYIYIHSVYYTPTIAQTSLIRCTSFCILDLGFLCLKSIISCFIYLISFISFLSINHMLTMCKPFLFRVSYSLVIEILFIFCFIIFYVRFS